jgi:WD40 repeat protein
LSYCGDIVPLSLDKQLRSLVQRIPIVLFLLWAPLCQANLIIDVSADGSALVTATGNRVIYEHNPETLEVIKRTRTNQNVGDLALSADGSLIFCADGAFDQIVSVRDRKTGKILSETPRIDQIGGFGGGNAVFAVSKTANMLAYRDKQGKFSIVNMADGKTTGTIQHDMKVQIQLAILSPDGKTLTVISKGLDSTKEEKSGGRVNFNAKLDDIIKHEKADGKVSKILHYDTSTGKLKSELETFYDTSSHQTAYGFWHGTDLHIVTYGDVNATISNDGKTEIYRTKVMAYGFGATHDGGRFTVGSMINSGVLIDTKNMKQQKIEAAPANRGFPEYYRSMVFDAAGKYYGMTGDLRVFRVDGKNKMHVIKPVM